MSVPTDLVKRLEAVAVRLESYASGLGGSSAAPAAAAAAAGGASGASHPKVTAYKQFVATYVTPFVEANKTQTGLAAIGEDAEKGFAAIGNLLEAVVVSKKPSDSDLLSFLQPVIAIISKAGEFNDNRHEFFNQFKAWAEMSVGVLSWVTQDLPRPFVQDQLEAADFYFNKVLVAAKGGKGEAYGKFATSAKELMKNLQPFITANYATGLEWNPKGDDLKNFKSSSSSSSSSSSVPPPPGPPCAPAPPGPPSAPSFTASSSAPAKPTTSGMGAVFGELTSKDVTSGLKKVTSDMKTKNRKDEPALEVKAKTPVAAPAPVAKTNEVKKEPALYLSKGTWFVEHQENNQNVIIPESELQLKESVYILKCKNATIHVPVKCKSIQVDGCHRVNLVFKSVVSLVEVFNSQRIKVECEESVPSLAIDKVAGVSVILSRSAVVNPPNLITSNITEVNLVVPGKTDEDDPIEIPLPEQYTTVFDPSTNKLHTEAVAHSAN